MADQPISTMTAATTPTGTELVEVVQGGVNKRTTIDAIALKSKTLAELNTQVSDATLIDTGDSRLSDARTPTAHNLGGSEHSADTLANLNSKVSDATLARTDAAQTFTGNQHTGETALSVAAGAIAITPSDNNSYAADLSADAVLSNPGGTVEAGMAWVIVFTQTGAGGWALTFDTQYCGPPTSTGSATLDTSADVTGDQRVLSFYAISATKILVVAVGEAV